MPFCNATNKIFIRQCLAIITVFIDVFLCGVGLTYSATLLAQLDEPDSGWRIDDNDKAWIASISSISCLPGTILGSVLIELFGPKWAFLFTSAVNMGAWSLIASSTAITQLLIGRALQRFTMGLGYPIGYFFLNQVATLEHRSVLLNLINIASAWGMLFPDLLGAYVPWQLTAWISAACATIYFLILLYLKNTHVWYLQRNCSAEAESVFYWYKAKNEVNQCEFKADRFQYEHAEMISMREIASECSRKEFILPLGIMLWYCSALTFSGGFGIMLYSISIMESVVTLDPYATTIGIDCIRILAAALTIFALKRWPIRWIVNTSSLFCAVSLLVIAGGLHWSDTWMGLNWIVLASLMIFIMFYSLGYMNMVNISMGELFTGISKSTGTCLTVMYIYASNFAIGHLIPMMFAQLGNAGTFLAFAGCNILGGIGMYIILPETRHVSNEGIRRNFQECGKKAKNNKPNDEF